MQYPRSHVKNFLRNFLLIFFHGEDISVDLRHIFLLFYINNKERNYMMHDLNLRKKVFTFYEFSYAV